MELVDMEVHNLLRSGCWYSKQQVVEINSPVATYYHYIYYNYSSWHFLWNVFSSGMVLKWCSLSWLCWPGQHSDSSNIHFAFISLIDRQYVRTRQITCTLAQLQRRPMWSLIPGLMCKVISLVTEANVGAMFIKVSEVVLTKNSMKKLYTSRYKPQGQ